MSNMKVRAALCAVASAAWVAVAAWLPKTERAMEWFDSQFYNVGPDAADYGMPELLYLAVGLVVAAGLAAGITSALLKGKAAHLVFVVQVLVFALIAWTQMSTGWYFPAKFEFGGLILVALSHLLTTIAATHIAKTKS